MTGLDRGLARGIDVVAALAGLVLLSPLLAAIAAAIRRHDGGPVLYRARRVGRNGIPFDLLKFRTMIVAADRQGPGITTGDDSRITPVGRRLRRTKLDELPQLWNVLRGEMSLVGPRPEDPRYVVHYSAAERAILLARPGITSAASLHYRDEARLLTGANWEETYLREVMPAKLALDLAYLQQRTVLSDLALVVRTLAAVAR